MEMEALERVAEESELREVGESLRREEERERSEVQRLALQRRIEALNRMNDKRLEAELRQEATLQP